jgi:hypothetical protein
MQVNFCKYAGKSDVSKSKMKTGTFCDFHYSNTNGKIQRLLLTPF